MGVGLDVRLAEVHAEFIGMGGVSVIVASRNARRVPSNVRGIACRVSADRRRVTVILRRSQSAQLLEDIQRSGCVAVCFTQPTTHRTIQLKAEDAVIEPAQAGDVALAERFIAGFHRELGPLGYSEDFVRALLGYAADDLLAVGFSPSAVFGQTPGPRAGERLS